MIKNVLLCGLGGVGCVCACAIEENKSADLRILVDKKRLETYLKTPTTFNKKPYFFKYILPSDKNFKADLIIIATKNNGLDEAIQNIKNFVKNDTIIISLLNGIHSEDKIAAVYGADKVLISFYIGNSCIRQGRDITLEGDYSIFAGEKTGQFTEKTEKIKQFFEKSKINYKLSQKITERYLRKFMVNVGLNQLCAVNNMSFKELKRDKILVDRLKALIGEVRDIIKEEGIKSSDEIYTSTIKFLIDEFEDAIPSMLQDIRAKRETEVDIFAGEVIKRGEKYNIKTPENQKIYEQIKQIENGFNK